MNHNMLDIMSLTSEEISEVNGGVLWLAAVPAYAWYTTGFSVAVYAGWSFGGAYYGG